MRAFRILSLLIWMWAGNAAAQTYGRVEETVTNGAYFHYVRPGIPTVQVYVLGTIGRPGMYELSQGTDLGQLLALTGGPTISPLQSSNRRIITVRLFRPVEGMDKAVFETQLDGVLTRQQSYPLLQEGDILTVEILEKQKFHWRDALSLVGSISALALVVQQFLF